MVNTMSTHTQVAEIKKMHWYQRAEMNRLMRLHSPFHWPVIVWQGENKWVECVKCHKKLTDENDKECER